MKKLLVLAALALPGSAHALGVGTTFALGDGSAALGSIASSFGGGSFRYSTAVGFLPSLDLHPGLHTVQIHVLETLRTLEQDEELYLGANAYFGVVQAATGGAASAVVEPGFGADLWIGNQVAIGLTGQCRLGVVLPGEGSFGVYAVPALGFLMDDGDVGVIYGGTAQFSVWFGQ